jgi:hypothetical protein
MGYGKDGGGGAIARRAGGGFGRPNINFGEDKPVQDLKFEARTSLPEFEAARNRVTSQFAGEKTSGNDAIERRFASLGALNSGAAIKQTDNFQNKLREQESQALGDLNAQEAGQLATMNDERKFQVDAANRDMAFKNKVFSFERGSKMYELDLAERQFQEDRRSTDFNKRLAEMEAGRDPGLLGGRVIKGII